MNIVQNIGHLEFPGVLFVRLFLCLYGRSFVRSKSLVVRDVFLLLLPNILSIVNQSVVFLVTEAW